MYKMNNEMLVQRSNTKVIKMTRVVLGKRSERHKN